MAVFQSVFNFFLPSRRRFPTPPVVTPQGMAVVAGLEKAFAAIDALNVPDKVANSLKEDLTGAFDIRAEAPSGYEPGSVAPVKTNVLDLVSNPLKTAWTTLDKSFTYGFPALSAAWEKPESKVWEEMFGSGWEGPNGRVDVPYSLQQAVLRWNEKAELRVTRLAAEKYGIRRNPGLTLMMGNRMLAHYYSEVSHAPTPQIANALMEGKIKPLAAIVDVARDWEGRVSGVLSKAEEAEEAAKTAWEAGDFRRWKGFKGSADGFYKEAEGLQKEWVKQSKGSQDVVIGEFEALARGGEPLEGTPEARFWRYWQLRNIHYQTLNLLHTYKKDGLGGVATTYLWKEFVNSAFGEKGTWRYYLYLPHAVNKVQEKAVGWVLKPVLNQVTTLKTWVDRVWSETASKAAKKILGFLGKKLGLEALGGAIGSAIPVAGTAIGAAIGGAIQFVGDLLFKELGKVVVPIFRFVAYLLLGVVGSLILFSIGVTVLLSIVLSNTPYPWEAGGSAAKLQNMVRVDKKAALAGGSNFANPLKLTNGSYSVEWKITVKNVSGNSIDALSFSDKACGISEEIDELTAGEQKEFSCTKSISGQDEIVTNTATLALSQPNLSEQSVGLIILGNPPVSFPSGWPLDHGCLAQGPDGPFSHAGAEAIDIDVVAVAGKPVHATFTGYVGYACWVPGSGGCEPNGYGNYVRLRALDGSFSAIFGHLATVSVKTGDPIKEGQVLGTVGTTGNSTGFHLHYEFLGLPMKEPYIPKDDGIRGCDSDSCHLCW